LEKKLKRERILIIVEIEQLITKLALQNKIFVILYYYWLKLKGILGATVGVTYHVTRKVTGSESRD